MSNIKFISILLIVLLAGLISANTVQANTVSFDSSFGTAGKVITSFNQDANNTRTAIQSDGKIVVVGNASNGSIYGWAIARYNADGTLDTSFGNNGVVTKYFAANSSLKAVGIQSDGKIVVGGDSNTGTYCNSTPVCWTIARYNADGTLDTSFGNNGINVTVFINPNLGSESLQSLVIQPDGKIVAAGTTANVGVVRYNTDGSIDFQDDIVIPPDFTNCPPTFSPNQSCGNTADGANAVHIQPDGKIVIAGTWAQYGVFQSHAYVLRLNGDGSFDTSFGNGSLSYSPVMARDGLNDMVLQPDGKIVIAGGGCVTDCSSGGDTFVARLTSSGGFDNTFGTSGKVIYSIVGNDAASAILLQSDNKLLLGGYEDTQSAAGLDFALRRLNPGGTQDVTFGTNGSFITPIGQSNDAINDIALQADGKLIAVGSVSNGSYNDWALARFSLTQPSVTVTFNSAGDTYLKGGEPNRNEGAGFFMRLQATGNNRSMVRFDQAALESAVGNGTVLSAKVRLTITDNENNWGTTGRTVDLHRLLSNWAEGNGTENDRGSGNGATWNCAIDSIIENQAKNCSGVTEWEMGQPNNPVVHPWVETASATQNITNNQSGVVEFDVTADVASFLNSTSQNYGWIIKKTEEGQTGQVSFGTRESSSVPQLVVTYQP